ncbi:MAG: undecaprenyl-phosphate glucose phosphotransferase [Sandaracinus sp.]|nr:undecaprenyl-phosphate glucose phosphotransferase [Sandaracinus sp.]MCB9634239.1 undecaprenyl-phosphate glucose phosphotransferase [Sandaracinus sp.]
MGLRLADASFVALSHFVAVLVAGEPWADLHTEATIVAAVVFHFAAQSIGLYRAQRSETSVRETGRVFGAWFTTAAVLLLIGFLTKRSTDYSRFITLTWIGATPLVVAVFRASLRAVLRSARSRGRNTRSVAIAGLTELGERVARVVDENRWMGMRVVGFYDDRFEERCHPIPAELGKREGNLDDLVEKARTGEVDIVYIALPLRAETRVTDLVRRLADSTASVYMAADFDAFDLLSARWGQLGNVPVVSIHETPFYGVSGWLKRLEDIVVGSMILALIAVPMLFVAIGVKLTSKGPVFFRQRRYGLNGEVIHVLKFRSMTVMDDGAEVKQATKNDQRITKFGGFLRRTSLDELPQFFHVITGTMSIVGPRPHAVSHNEQYRKQIEGYMLRHKVKPGITGWAQVNGWRGETDTLEKMEQRIAHDLAYIRNWSLMWDLQIIFLTVFGRKVRKNAY